MEKKKYDSLPTHYCLSGLLTALLANSKINANNYCENINFGLNKDKTIIGCHLGLWTIFLSDPRQPIVNPFFSSSFFVQLNAAN